MSTCRTCKWLDVPVNKAGKIVPRKGMYLLCKAPIPAPPVMPASIRVYTDGRWRSSGNDINWPTVCGRMSVDDGEGCTFHEPRQK